MAPVSPSKMPLTVLLSGSSSVSGFGLEQGRRLENTPAWGGGGC